MAVSDAIQPRIADLAIRRALIAKRCFDILVSAFALVLLLPMFFCIALAIRLDSPGAVLFRQVRTGRFGRPFKIVKFRSMTASPGRFRQPLTADGDPRVTRVGAFLRSSKLDELPQLFNVLAGHMSLVGPRPEVPDLFAHYTPAEQAAFLSLRPGVTDYASLLLRDEGMLLAHAMDPLTFYRQCIMPIKHELCVRYLNEMSFLTDMRIIAATLGSVVSHKAPESLIEQRLLQRVIDWTRTPAHGSLQCGNEPDHSVATHACDGRDP